MAILECIPLRKVMINFIANSSHACTYVIDEQDPYQIIPSMVNPFDPPQPIFWLICPTHQVYMYFVHNFI